MVNISARLPSHLAEVYEAVAAAAGSRGIPLFVVGAGARDLLLRYAHDIPPHRTTQDVDVAIRVNDWKAFDLLVSELLQTHGFHPTNREHRLVSPNGVPVDLVPFGPIAGETRTISWRSREERVMGVVGFEEAFAAALPVILRMSPRLEIPVASLAGLAMMKLLSWDSARPFRPHDAQDFHFIASSYLDAGNQDRLVSDAADLVRQRDFDTVRASAQLLGRDVKLLAESLAQQTIRVVLERELAPDGPLDLVGAIISNAAIYQEREQEVFEALLAFQRGFMER